DRLAISSSKSVQGIETVPQQDGLHHSHVRKFPILGREGTPVLVGGVAFDITERLRAEEALRESEQRFRLLVEGASTAMLMVDSEGRITLVNSQLEKLFGYQRQELLGQPAELLLPRRYQSQHRQLRADFFRAPAARPMGAGRDLFGLRKDGTEVPVEIGLNPLRIAEQTFVLASIIDITERKQGEVLSAAFSTLGQ